MSDIFLLKSPSTLYSPMCSAAIYLFIDAGIHTALCCNCKVDQGAGPGVIISRIGVALFADRLPILKLERRSPSELEREKIIYNVMTIILL
jgi:hypothetical protein